MAEPPQRETGRIVGRTRNLRLHLHRTSNRTWRLLAASGRCRSEWSEFGCASYRRGITWVNRQDSLCRTAREARNALCRRHEPGAEERLCGIERELRAQAADRIGARLGTPATRAIEDQSSLSEVSALAGDFLARIRAAR